jgi:NAD(P)-dependent dehydrogenase (short-subunit alcohol dehydrogenase family)
MSTATRRITTALIAWTLATTAGVIPGNGTWLDTQELSAQDGGQRAVLVTGASSGIGRRVTEVLSANGYFVYAGARKAEDLRALNEIENVQSIRLDVTIQEEIDAAVQVVTNAGRGLYGLMNNAGVGVAGPLIEVPEEDLAFQLDVNVFGPYRITKAFAPLIIESQGRITTTGSISGILSSAFLGPYSMSKHAIEAYTDALAVEMAVFGVDVSVVEPGNYKSNIVLSLRDRMDRAGYTSEGSLYADQMDAMLGSFGDRSQYKEPDEVAQAVLDFFSEENPKRRYMVVPNEGEAELTIRKAIQEMVELNEGHVYSFDREVLVRMLDEALSGAR